LNTRDPHGEGTLILSRPSENGARVKSIAYKEGVTVVHLVSTRMFRSHGFLERVFALFDRHRVSPDLVATSQVSIAVAFWEAEELTPLIAGLRELGEVEVRDRQAVVCVVGERLKETPGIVSQVFDDLEDVKTSMVSLGGSEINLGFVVEESQLPLVVNRLHRSFFGAAAGPRRVGQGGAG
jgi:aspartate kinase